MKKSGLFPHADPEKRRLRSMKAKDPDSKFDAKRLGVPWHQNRLKPLHVGLEITC
jgi:hypothetical protein